MDAGGRPVRAFSPEMGRPTQELYSMAGLLLLMEFMDWTKQEALDAYSFRMDAHYALNLEPVTHDLSIQPLEWYIQYFQQEDLAQEAMHKVTTQLVGLLEIKIDRQRLDSTHVFSDMASFGRTRLMGVAVKRFLTQVKRHDPLAYASLEEALRQRYAPSVHQLFGQSGTDSESRRLLLRQVAEDMHGLIHHFGDKAEHAGRSSDKAMERIFHEQCEVQEDKVVVKSKTGGNVLQNPSDLDATYDGHKGPGYQVQIAETCHPQNEVQRITSALPQTAAEPDAHAVEPVLEDLHASQLLPEQMLVDAKYRSDEDVQLAGGYSVERVGPVRGGEPENRIDDLCIDDFVLDETAEQVICCPDGHKPVASIHDRHSGQTRTTMPESACSRCAYQDQRPVEKGRHGYHLEHTAKQRRVAARRREEATQVFSPAVSNA
jgi:hypothetical protein